MFEVVKFVILLLSKNCDIKADIKSSYAWVLKPFNFVNGKSQKNDKNIELELTLDSEYTDRQRSCACKSVFSLFHGHKAGFLNTRST